MNQASSTYYNEDGFDILATPKQARRSEYASVRSSRTVKPERLRTNPGHAARNIDKLNDKYITAPSKVSRQRVKARDTGIEIVHARTKAVGETRIQKTKVIPSKRPFPIAMIVFSMMITAVFMYMLSLYVSIDDCNQKIADLQSSITDKQEEAKQLQLQLDSKFNLSEVSKIAQEEYGMVSADQLPKRYVTLTGDDVIEVVEVQKSGGFGVLLSAFGKLISESVE